MASNVHLFHKHAPKGSGIVSDNHKIAAARVQLKLYALAWVESRHGVDTSPAFVWDALVLFCEAAKRYVCSFDNSNPNKLVDPTITKDIGGASERTMTGRTAAAGRQQLKLGALAYEATRRGADGGIGFSRDGLAMLCQAAISYVEQLDNIDRTHLRDRLSIEE